MLADIYDINHLQRTACKQLSDSHRSEFGQYMTSSSIANFMASLFNYQKKNKLLDAGAGVGSLTSAFLDKALSFNASTEVDAWEIDCILQKYLNIALEKYKNSDSDEIKIHPSDFIEYASSAIRQSTGNRYTHAILNPPYKKINSKSKHRLFLREIGIETVNLYSAFVALSILLLEKNGELVAIIPRSFCNGTYYRPFRKLILETCSIQQIHLFESRRKAFSDDSVLQENVIIHLVKNNKQGDIVISTSFDANFADYNENIFPASSVVKHNHSEVFIHIPTSSENEITPAILSSSLMDIGLEVCTGPVVDFRVKESCIAEPTLECFPLLYPHHFASGKLVWPKQHKKPNALMITPEIKKILMPKGHYVLVKRFSSKEEKRRVVAYHLEPESLNASFVGFENHWNIFHIGKKGIDKDIARGLTVFLNSTLLDVHFRVFSGHTQVNATDLRTMRYPNLEKLQLLGRKAVLVDCNDQYVIDKLIEGLQQNDDCSRKN